MPQAKHMVHDHDSTSELTEICNSTEENKTFIFPLQLFWTMWWAGEGVVIDSIVTATHATSNKDYVIHKEACAVLNLESNEFWTHSPIKRRLIFWTVQEINPNLSSLH